MPRRTNPFQKLTTSIMAAFYEPEFRVMESVLVRNKKTGVVRELDILIYDSKNPEGNILVECRDHKRKQDVQWIDELAGKAQRLNFRKIIAVSSSGFTGTATSEASERGIRTLHLAEAEEMDWRKWRFGLNTFGVNVNFDLRVREVKFVVPPAFAGTQLTNADRSRIFIVDTRKKAKVSLVDWVKGFQKDPKIIAAFAERDENDAINHYSCKIPCDPWIGFATEPEGRVVPLMALVISVDSIRAEYSVTLKHYDVGGERIHVGQSMILGRETKLVLHETNDKLKVMIEQIVPRSGSERTNDDSK